MLKHGGRPLRPPRAVDSVSALDYESTVAGRVGNAEGDTGFGSLSLVSALRPETGPPVDLRR